jgi:hypothetical protein
MKSLRYCTSLLLISFASGSGICAADTSWRVTPDFIFKSQWLSETNPSPGLWLSAGIDAYKQLNNKNSTFATATLQLYQWCVSDRVRKPPVLDGTDDCHLISKVSTLEFHVSGDGKFNILVGHPELPYGLEVPVSTNETIRTLLTPRDTGLKLDWGVGVRGTLSQWSYAATLTRGSGFEWENESRSGEEPWAFAGRIGTATDAQRFLPSKGFGFSWFTAEALNPAQVRVKRWRLAADWIHYLGPWGLMTQLSVGKTEGRDVYNFFGEVNRSTRDESLTGYLQYKSFNEEFVSGWQAARSVHLGGRYALTDKVTLSAQIAREFEVFANGRPQTIFDLQFRYRLE